MDVVITINMGARLMAVRSYSKAAKGPNIASMPCATSAAYNVRRILKHRDQFLWFRVNDAAAVLSGYRCLGIQVASLMYSTECVQHLTNVVPVLLKKICMVGVANRSEIGGPSLRNSTSACSHLIVR